MKPLDYLLDKIQISLESANEGIKEYQEYRQTKEILRRHNKTPPFFIGKILSERVYGALKKVFIYEVSKGKRLSKELMNFFNY